MLGPLPILLIGLVSVIGMILILRLNAFIALITSAMLVSLLSPGALGDKISRVAVAFGTTAGNIGIVIALAAVIGKCLMDSGAADRIVRSFLRLLGEKRSSVALMGSSFVLAMPVFFDTVFYLLVPLARSLWKRTRKNYVLYVTAIAAGGAITHTLVPPTPGPLFMAERLGIDMGVMILVGTLIGLPMAAVGLLVCRVMNRLMDLPMRPLGSEPEPEPLDDAELPGLCVALLPVLLPVLLISINTLTNMAADAEHAALLRPADVKDWAPLVEPPPQGRTAEGEALRRLRAHLPKPMQEKIAGGEVDVSDADSRAVLVAAVNRVLEGRKFYDKKELRNVDLPAEAEPFLARDLDRLPQAQVEHFNRLVLEAALPGVIGPHVWDTSRRKAASVTAVLGNPNLALLLSAAIAMITLARQRGLTLGQLAASTENALLSGGVIILITAGGGAFGGMLGQAGIREAVEQSFGSGGQISPVLLLLVGYGIAAVMKVAQGSGTVSMMTTSAIMAPILLAIDQPAFHAVYMAAAIGCGSLTGSWMNDSGFWIFARMSGLTEVEALKTWTILLVILGVVGLGLTLTAATVLPLV